MKEIVGAEIAKRINSGDVIGVGTGSTVDAALKKIAERVSKEKLDLHVVPTSYQTAWQCEEIGLQVLYPGFRGELTWGFDGADAVDQKRLWLIKGKGAALLQEKILAARCKTFSIIVDDSKLTDNIASKCAIPVELIPQAYSVVERGLKKLGAKGLELRAATGKHGPIITEGGNLIIDASFDKVHEDLERDIKSIVGVVENGLFMNYASEIIVAGAQGIRVLKP